MRVFLILLSLLKLKQIAALNDKENQENNIHGSFPIEDYSSYEIQSICIYFNFQDNIQHLAFLIKTNNNKHYQLDLRLEGYKHQWTILLQQDDRTNRLMMKYEYTENCLAIRYHGVKTVKDMTDIAEKFIKECYHFKFYFKYVFELQSMSEWEEMLDFEHEKKLERVNCMAFTDYYLNIISQKYQRRWIKEMIIERGKEIFYGTKGFTVKD